MLGGRRRRTSTFRNEDPKAWAHESDSDHPRQTMAASQRPNVDYAAAKQHRASKRADPSVIGNLPTSSAPPAPKGPSPRDYADAGGAPYYPSSQYQNQAAYPHMPPAAVGSSSRARAPDNAHEPNSMLAYLKRKTERRSPRSSDEKVHATGRTKSSQPQPRSGYATAVPATTVPTMSTRPQPAPDTAPSHKTHRDKERDRERRRERELEKERLREERYREIAAALEREKEEKERQARRAEKELRRAEREKEKERERRREGKEFERARKQREKDRLREKESRPRDPLPGVVYPYHPAATSTKHYAEGKASYDQVPSSSSNVALPATQYASAYAAGGSRARTTSDPRPPEAPTSATYAPPPQAPEKERKSHRSRRDKAAQQYGGESGMSSSEQEHSGRERATRTSDRRKTQRDYHTDAQQSGPSGSDTERASRDRRRASRAAGDPYGSSRHYATPGQTNGSVPLAAQTSATVGSASLPRIRPQIVSIRAGQGPADPDTPQLRAMNQGRSKDMQAPFPTTAQHSSYQPANPGMPQGHGYPASQGYAPASSMFYNDAPQDGPQSGQNASYQPSSHGLLHPSATPRSMTTPMQSTNQAQRPSPAFSHKIPLKSSPGKNEAVLNLSVYQPPGPTVSADLLLPAHQQSHQTQTVTVNHTTVQDLAAKFPLNEDALTSASSSTLAPGQGKDQMQRRTQEGVHKYPETDPYGRASQPPPDALFASHPGASFLSPAQQPPHALHSENTIPIPIPGPRGNGQGTYADTRGQKAQQTSRPQTTPLQSKSAALPTYGSALPYPPTDYTHDPYYTSSKHAAVSGQQQTSNSPARSTHQYLQRSPSTIDAAPPAHGTPKQSPSIRLQQRNGSSDTVSRTVGKGSPHDASAARSIRHSNSNTNLQTYGTSRPDTTTTRTTTAGYDYPDTGRRPSTSTYPPNNSQPGTYYPNHYPPHPSTSHAHHSRSASQPTVPYPHFEQEPAPQRSQTHPVPTPAPANPAMAPSASAIVAAYRTGQYNTEQTSRAPPAPSQRVPPRSAPSPAPTLTQQQYAPAPSIMSKSGYTLPPGASQPVRGQSYSAPSASRPQGPSHSRTVSDPQNNPYSTSNRVAVAGHPSTPAPPKAQLALHPTASEQELLMTPSSLAPSMLKGGQAPHPNARPPSIQTTKGATSDKEGRKRGILGLFRSRSSPPKPDARNPLAAATAPGPEPTKPRQRSSSQTTINAVAASVRNIITPHPNPNPLRPQPTRPPAHADVPYGEPTSSSYRAPPTPAPVPEYDRTNPSPRRRMAESIAPTLVPPAPAEARPSGRKSPNSKMFTPFRLISKKHRTVSAASVEALDGTAANTVIGGESARSSTAGRLSPPLRDPFSATQDWRNREEAQLQDRGTYRRRRPGVVFDVAEEFTETETHQPARKQPRR